MNPQTGEIRQGSTAGVGTPVLIGLLEIVKNMILNQQVKPKDGSGLVLPSTKIST